VLVVVRRAVGMPMTMIVLSMGRRRIAQPHLFGPIFPVQRRILPYAHQPSPDSSVIRDSTLTRSDR
jgi:hypothetical protein